MRTVKKVKKISKAPSIDIHVATHDDEVYMDKFCKWYKNRFANAKIYVHDNYSTDGTTKKALENGCSVQNFGSPAFHDENALTHLKNNCFKGGESEYFIICDIDELIDLSEQELMKYSPTFVQGRGWQVVNLLNQDFEFLSHGVRDTAYDKFLCFKRESVLEINYSNGAHKCFPVLSKSSGKVRLLRRNLFHFRWLSLDHVLKRFHSRSTRVKLNSENYSVLQKWHYDISESELKSEFQEMVERATAIRIAWAQPSPPGINGLQYMYEIIRFFMTSLKLRYFRKTIRLMQHEFIAMGVDVKRRFFYDSWSIGGR